MKRIKYLTDYRMESFISITSCKMKLGDFFFSERNSGRTAQQGRSKERPVINLFYDWYPRGSNRHNLSQYPENKFQGGRGGDQIIYIKGAT